MKFAKEYSRKAMIKSVVSILPAINEKWPQSTFKSKKAIKTTDNNVAHRSLFLILISIYFIFLYRCIPIITFVIKSLIRFIFI